MARVKANLCACDCKMKRLYTRAEGGKGWDGVGWMCTCGCGCVCFDEGEWSMMGCSSDKCQLDAADSQSQTENAEGGCCIPDAPLLESDTSVSMSGNLDQSCCGPVDSALDAESTSLSGNAVDGCCGPETSQSNSNSTSQDGDGSSGCC